MHNGPCIPALQMELLAPSAHASPEQPMQRELLDSPEQRRTSVVLELLRQKPLLSGSVASCEPGSEHSAPMGHGAQKSSPPRQLA